MINMNMTMSEVESAQSKARVRKLEQRHLDCWIDFLSVANLPEKHLAIYNPVGLSKKPNSYMGAAEATYLQSHDGQQKAIRGEKIAKWIFRVEAPADWNPPVEFAGDTWQWRRHSNAWLGV